MPRETKSNPKSAFSNPSGNTPLTVRIDKWLWAARFFKTRSLAADAVKTGKVLLNNERCKASRDLQGGEQLTLRQGINSKIIDVIALSARRGPAPEAQKLYRETDDSITNRERLKLAQQSQPGLRRHGEGRPTKKERRQIIQFTEKL